MIALDRPISIRIIAAIAATASLAGLAIAILRIASAASFIEPIQTTTSGWEQQPLFDLWRVLNNEDLYLDRARIPFHTAFYNWLFYHAYAPVTRLGLAASGLDMAWLPTFARGFTLVGALVGTAAFFLILRRMIPVRTVEFSSLALAAAITVFAGPLVGFWVFTVRPDVWALTFEMLAVLVFWKLDRTRPWLAIAAAAALAYAAWGFKHNNIFAAGTILLFLLTRREIGRTAAFASLLIGGYGLTFLVAPPNYFPSLMGVILKPIVELGFRNLANFTVKALPFLLPLAALLAAFAFLPPLRRALIANNALRFVAIGSVVSLGLGFVGGFKEGAGENYYFPALGFLALTAMVGWQALEERGNPREIAIVRLAMMIGWTLHGLALAGVLLGFWGVLSMRFLHDYNVAGRACVERLPQPVFTFEQYLSLPWMNPSRPIVFMDYNHSQARLGETFTEPGKVGALIESGYFGALVILGKPMEIFDGARLALRYDADASSCPGRTVYRRRSAPTQ